MIYLKQLQLMMMVLLLIQQRLYAQSPPVIDISAAKESVQLSAQYSWSVYTSPVNSDSLFHLSLQRVQPGEYPVNRKNFTGHFVFAVAFSNSSAKTDTILFLPGQSQQVAAFLYDTINRQAIALKDTMVAATPYRISTLQAFRLQIPAGGYRQLFIQTTFRHFNWDYWEPAVFRQNAISDKLLVYQYPVEIRSHMISAIHIGILLAILGYTLVLYFQYRQQEYLWYIAYVFLITAYFLYMAAGNLSYSYSFHCWDMFTPPFTQVSAHLIYFFFAKKILNLPENKPFFNKMINMVIGVLAAYLIFHAVISFDDRFLAINGWGFFLVRIFLCIFSFYGIVVLYRSGIPLSFYIATGVLCLTIFGLLSMYGALAYSDTDNSFMTYIGGSITIFRVGVVIELFVFLVAITEKAKTEIINKVRVIELLRIDNERKELEKSMIALETQTAERKRISAEMHDDIGSGLTTIQFLSNALPFDKTTGQEQAIYKITATAQQLMDKMNEIVWSLNQDFDTLGDTLAYIRNTVSEMLENAGIGYEFSSPDRIPELELNGETRRNLYLVVKEATHNIIKHANATMVNYSITVGDTLVIHIRDNGKGIREQGLSSGGNGMKNMQQRMKSSGGSFSMLADNGTIITLVLPLHS